MYEPFYQVDMDLGEEIEMLNGWISIRNIYTPGRNCYFCIAGRVSSPPNCNDCSNGFLTGIYSQQPGGGYTGNWYNWPTGEMYMCLSHNGVNFSGSPLRVFDPALYTWNGLADAWQDQGVSAAAADNFTVPDFFNKITLWGGFGIGSYSSPSCISGTTETFLVDIYTQDPATNATPVQSLTKTGTLTPTGFVFHELGNQPIYKVEITFTPSITITSGWIRVRNINTAGRPCKFGWLYSSDPNEGTYLDGSLQTHPGGLFFNLSKPCTGDFVNAGPDLTVYYGYPPLAAARMEATGGLWYQWSPCIYTYELTFNLCEQPILRVMPPVTTTYTVTATNNEGCVDTDNATVNVIDVRCGTKLDKVKVCYRNKTQCVTQSQAQTMLAGGGYLGSCIKSDIIEGEEVNEFSLSAYPNPFSDRCTVQLEQPEGSNVAIEVTDLLGRQVGNIYEGYLGSGSHQFEWNNPGFGKTTYFIIARSDSEFKVIKLISQ
jgi:hypothetical protein